MSDYACIWCICKKGERGNQAKQWSMFDANKGARSIEKIIQWARAPQKYSCKHKPMFDFIPLDHVVDSQVNSRSAVAGQYYEEFNVQDRGV